MSRSLHRVGAFTLVELLAVVLVIAILAGVILGTAGYVQRRVAIQNTRAQLAAIEAALEMYKSDWGYYPATSPGRISVNRGMEATNNWILMNALCPSSGRKKYVSFPASQIRTNYTTAKPMFCDFWGTPFNYYNSPSTPYTLATTVYIVNGFPIQTNLYGYTLGGQVNVASYDLFSYGPDHFTYVPGVGVSADWNIAGHLTYNSSGSLVTNVWMQQSSAIDDITNFK